MRCDSSVSSSSLLLLHCYLAFLWHSALLPKLPDFVLKSSFLLSFKYIYVWFGSKMKVILGLQLTKTRISMMIFWWNLIIFHCFRGQKDLILFWTISYKSDYCVVQQNGQENLFVENSQCRIAFLMQWCAWHTLV